MAILILLALFAVVVGLGAASYLHRKKRTKKKMTCPLKATCEKVIHSTHATTLGIPNELLGMAYYVILGVLYALILAAPAVFLVPVTAMTIAGFTLVGILFSIYLVIIQFSVLHAWCSWCMLSALANVLLTVCAAALHFFS